MEKFLIEISSIPTEEASATLYEKIRTLGAINMFYTGTKAFIYGELDSTAVDIIEQQISDSGYEFTVERG